MVNGLWYNPSVLKLLLNIDQLLWRCLCALPVYLSFILLTIYDLFLLLICLQCAISIHAFDCFVSFTMSICDFLFNLCCLCLSCDGVYYRFLTVGGYTSNRDT